MSSKIIERLVRLFSRLPGVGVRSAKRIVLFLIKNKDGLMPAMVRALNEAGQMLHECRICKNIDEGEVCGICADTRRDRKLVCVVESVVDLWAIEEANFFKGVYHILGGTIASLHDQAIQGIAVAELVSRVEQQEIAEVIIATNATLEGQTTAFLITERLRPYTAIKVTRFAHGIPIGGELKYLDEVTLSAAFSGRQNF